MIPYGKHQITEKDIKAVVETLRSDLITQGPKVDEFEQALCDYFGCKYAVAVNNGTTALHLAYKALGVNSGDRVITTPNTFVATANGIVYNDGIPEFVDIDPETFNLDVDKLEEYLENPQNRENVIGIAPVHFAGLPCEMERISKLANRYNLFVLEDACHAPGAEWKDSDGEWHKVGDCSHSDAAVLSFHPVKHFTTGEGGAVLTNHEGIANKIRKLRCHGITNNRDEFARKSDGPWYYEMQEPGHNGRITDIQCALGINQLQRLDEMLELRRDLAGTYDKHFTDLPGLEVPESGSGVKHAYHLYVVQSKERDSFYESLESNDICPQIHYIPVHLQPFYQNRFSYGQGDFPVAEEYYSQALSLPMFPIIADDESEHVIETVKNFSEVVIG